MLSKLGVCSRTTAAEWIVQGRVTLAGRVLRDPEHPVVADAIGSIGLDGRPLADCARRYLMLNKPRGLVTTACDEHARDTVYRCFDGAGLPWLAPVGRLDKASEGLLLFCNDPVWAAAVTDPQRGPVKTYHVQVDGLPDARQLQAMRDGVVDARGERLCVAAVTLLRSGGRTAWLEITLDEGRNRQIRRLLAAMDLDVLRLLRVAIGGVRLGDLAKGDWRELRGDEVAALVAGAQTA